ncbi:MAG: threonine--tRNA ligase [Candidatus Sungbacteria bacterium RIFCSPHIGHO2_02_FULL_49_20]|uniref:Threonine--tRNA ligase n=1 Tax=Candidatus Sungbacteria bacterium RIFCSPHIGHO2_02_FULL_49_20 TaxID=1802272 RepID=A0A1G2KPK1_9BACT|nr:MAG: threonine--tRNA ligase [Candidatus Sungbacteria bacterium RIFCSPHIGHO2_02_FULL_49_20]
MPDQQDFLNSLRHSLAHLLAAAVMELWPKTKRAIGPATENGFYFDFEFAQPIGDADLPKIEAKMREILPTWGVFTKHLLTLTDAKKEFRGNPYKLELIREFSKNGPPFRRGSPAGGEKLSFYKSGDYWDLCRGGHVSDAKEISPEAFRLTRIAGAYWRGDEKNIQLTRIYGVAFPTKHELDKYFKMREEAERRDHRKLGKELKLFHISDEVGPGLPLFYPKGAMLRRTVENYIANLQESRGYLPIWIPHITKGELYKISGHLDKYDAMYPPMKLKGEADYYLKPMNCPHFMVLYKSEPHSYHDLPVRYTATTTNYRYEKSGELSGLTRVRSLTQDDCHVFAAPSQIADEINLMLDMIAEVYDKFGFKNFWVRISIRGPNKKKDYIGDPAVWDSAEETLQKLIKDRGWRQETGVGEAAFYGPKLDFIFTDVIGREWQLSTVQLDMNLPQRFTLEYIDADGQKQTPVVIHRAILGSTERFLGIITEHYAGAFPFWLAPVQIAILPINNKHRDYIETIAKTLQTKHVRFEIDERNESVGKKIRDAELQKIPYLLVIGDREAATKTVAVRERGKGDLGPKSLDAFMGQII